MVRQRSKPPPPFPVTGCALWILLCPWALLLTLLLTLLLAQATVQARQLAKLSRDFVKADALRAELLAKGGSHALKSRPSAPCALLCYSTLRSVHCALRSALRSLFCTLHVARCTLHCTRTHTAHDCIPPRHPYRKQYLTPLTGY